MAQWYEGWKGGNVELAPSEWVVQAGGFHIYRAESARVGGHFVNWLRGDNVVSTFGGKAISQMTPSVGADMTKSISWEFLTQFGTLTNHALYFWPVSNIPIDNPVPAAARGYFLYWNTVDQLRLFRRDAFDNVIINMDASWMADTNEHKIEITMEYVDATHVYWRVYLNDVLIGGPVEDHTYLTTTQIGFRVDNRGRVGEILISS